MADVYDDDVPEIEFGVKYDDDDSMVDVTTRELLIVGLFIFGILGFIAAVWKILDYFKNSDIEDDKNKDKD